MTKSSDLAARTVIDEMTVRILPTQSDVGEAAARFCGETIRERIATAGQARMAFATGNSQLAFARALAAEQGIDWSKVTVFHLDEYVGLPDDHPASFRRWIRTNIVEGLGVGRAHYLDGEAADPQAECDRYSTLLREDPLDMVCCGIGENGHVAFNEPGIADFADESWVKVVTLDERSRQQQVDEGHFATVADVPARALSLTIPAVMSAGTVQVVVPERRKAEAIRAALGDPVSTSCPATILRTRPETYLFLDTDSASLIPSP